jgi:hypothetical protein
MKIILINVVIGILLFYFFYVNKIHLSFLWVMIVSTILLIIEHILYGRKSFFLLLINCTIPVIFFTGYRSFTIWMYIGKDFGNLPYNYFYEVIQGIILMYFIIVSFVWIFTFLYYRFIKTS